MLRLTKHGFAIKSTIEQLKIEAWGPNGLRVRSIPANQKFTNDDFALLPDKGIEKKEFTLEETETSIVLKNGDAKVIYTSGILEFYRNDKLVLKDYSRQQSNVRRTIGIDEEREVEYTYSSSLNINPRSFEANVNGDYRLDVSFESNENEKIYGMGQYQDNSLNLKHSLIELAQRNTQSTIPFYVSSNFYGFLWNNPGNGHVNFSKNMTKWSLESTQEMEYWFTCGNDFKEISKNYATVSGFAPKIKKDLLGLWQSKLRYQTQDELETVLQGYRDRKIALSVIVVDYFHWTEQGDYQFDEKYWPDIERLIKELKQEDTKIMVSLWPTVSKDSKYFDEYEQGLLIDTARGNNEIFGNTKIVDFTNPEARSFVWDKINTNYVSKGIKLFWADQAEPEMSEYVFDNLRYHIGKGQNMSSLYPNYYAKMLADNLHTEERVDPILIRSAWAGGQKNGILLWSGDIDSSFESLQIQIKAGLNVGIAGIPFWTSDIGGFHGGAANDEDFNELLIRWFQYAVFTPFLRMHGDRQPHTQRIGDSGGGLRTSGGPNELWSFGEEVETILTDYVGIREKIKAYVSLVLDDASETGTAPMRPLFYEYPKDPKSFDISLQYFFGEALLVCPVTKKGLNELEVYLPAGDDWLELNNNLVYEGGKTYTLQLELDSIPVFTQKGFGFKDKYGF